MGLRRQTLLALLFVAAAAASGGQAARRGETQAVSSTLFCCSNTTAYHECVKACFEHYPREQADKICDPGCKEAYQCRAVSGDKCPTGQHNPAASSDDILTIDSSAAEVREGRALMTTLCCSNMTGFHECVHDCFAYFPREQAEKICNPGCQEAYQCRTVSGDKCPSGLLTNSVREGRALMTTLCCSNMTGFHECVHDCFAYFPREQAEKICNPGCQEAYQCRTISGDKCPSGLLTASEGNNAVEKCVSGCTSSVCNKMVTGVCSKRVAVKHALGRCNNACYNFCTKGLPAGTATA